MSFLPNSLDAVADELQPETMSTSYNTLTLGVEEERKPRSPLAYVALGLTVLVVAGAQLRAEQAEQDHPYCSPG